MLTQQDIYATGSESRPPMLNKENYVPWSSRLLRYAKSRPNGKLIHNSIINGSYVRRMIPEPCDTNREVPMNETFHVQTDDELIEKELKQIEVDDQAIQTILLDLPEDIYATVDSCETAQEIWLRVQQMMKGSQRIGKTKDLHTADYTQLYNFLKYNQKKVDELKVERIAKTQDPLALMATSNIPYNFPVLNKDQPSFNQNYMQQPMPNPKDITNPRISSNPRNRQIAQPGMNMGQDRQMQMVKENGNANQNLNGNGNLVAVRAEGNAAGHNGNQIRCYNCRGVAEEFDPMAAAADLDEIEKVNANCILMANLQQASTSGTQTDKAPVYDSDGSVEVIQICLWVYFVEGLGHNLFSIGQFCDSDLEVVFRRNTCFVRNLKGADLLKGNRTKNLYTINLHDMASASPNCLMARASSTKSWLWHQRLSYLNFDTINDLAKNDLVSGLPKFKYHKEHLCPSCEQGKSKRASHPPKHVPNSRQMLHLLYMDLCGLMRIASINGKRYVLVIMDDYSRYTWVHFLRYKDEAPETLVEAARTMLIFSRAPLFLWAEAIVTACFTQNRSIIHRRFNKTPYELINGRKPNISFLHVCGALCYPKNDREDIGKLGAKGDIGFFIGYSVDSRAYKVYNRRTKKIMETMNVSFDELSAMDFEQRSSKLGLQSMTSGQISSGLDLTYAPSTITTQQPTEGELDLLFEAMYDDFIGGQPSAAQRTVLAAQAKQVRQMSTTSTSIADYAPTPTNSSYHATNFSIMSQDVDELNSQQHVQQQRNQAHLQSETVADNVQNAMFDGNTFVNPFANSSTSAAESSSLQNELEKNLVTYSPDFQSTSEPSNASTNVVNAPREPYVVKQDNGSFVDKIIFRAPDSPDQFHCFHCKDVLRDGEACKRCTCAKFGSGLGKGLCYICGHNQNSLNDSPGIFETFLQSPPNINHCCYECGDQLDGIFCKRCTCKSCGKDAHIGYNCPSKVPEPDHSLSMGDEHLDTILAMESDEFIKSGVKNLIPIPNFFESNEEFSSNDDDSFSIDDIDYVEASPPDPELVSSEVMEIVILEVGGIDDDILLTIEHNILHEKLLNVNLLISKIEALNANPTPSSDCKTKSSSTSLNSLLEETNTFDNSLPEFETFCFDMEEISSGSTTTHPDISLPEFEAFHDDHVKEISSGSPTTHSDSSFYASFMFDLSINPFPPTNRSDSYEFTDELIPFISAPEYDCFRFKVEPNSRDFTKDVVEDIYPTKEPQVLNALPTHPTL
nr:integrase, catalytic region, zinc finger, CCHC-type, peptidase aspartic, catalytic [Tanacetum cinerariifolium]